MVDYSLDEKVGGASLIAAGLISSTLIINGNISTSTAWIGALFAIVGGVYSYLEQPYNEVALFGFSILALFALGPAILFVVGTQSLVGISLLVLLGLMLVSLIAGFVDVAEEFL
jgi:hypothetical protein